MLKQGEDMVVRRLSDAPFSSNNELANELGLDKAQVSRRVTSLRQRKTIGFKIDYSAAYGYHDSALVMLKVDVSRLKDASAGYSGLIDFSSFLKNRLMDDSRFARFVNSLAIDQVWLIEGGFDCGILLMSSTTDSRLDFVAELLSLSGVKESQTISLSPI
jgi:DNA-binding Lrp family transcriptional regulator